jgi:ABC-type polysaccharide/polyol phosphate export permease
MMRQFGAIFWKEWISFKSKFISITISALVGPALYLIAFGWGLGGAIFVNGVSYIVFIIPGLIVMNTMTSGFSTIATDINLSRSYLKTFEAVMTSPINMPVYTIARITANVLRSFYGAILILLIAFITGSPPHIDWYFILILILNCYVFSTIGFIAGLLVDSHADLAKISSLIITPMSFLGGTFFPIERFPSPLRIFFELLPLTQALKGLRAGASAEQSFIPILALAAYLLILLPLAIKICGKAE